MFYLTKEALIETHITNQPPFSLPPPFSSSIPSPLPGWAHRHTFIHNNTHIRTVIIKHTHARVHKRTHRDQPAAICSTCSVQSSQNTLFTTIHHITFPQCHSLVLEKSERERREESRKQNSYCTMKKREIKRDLDCYMAQWREDKRHLNLALRWNKVVNNTCSTFSYWARLKIQTWRLVYFESKTIWIKTH